MNQQRRLRRGGYRGRRVARHVKAGRQGISARRRRELNLLDASKGPDLTRSETAGFGSMEVIDGLNKISSK